MIDVAIITPFYSEPYWLLNRNVKSVQEQKTNYSFVQVIVADTPEISYLEFDKITNKYSNIMLSVHSVNKGLPVARNTGIRLSNSKYIILLDADDVMVPDRIQKQLDFMEKEHIDHSYGGYREIHGNSSEPDKKEIIPPEDPRGDLGNLNNVCYCGSNCFRRSICEEIGDFDENMLEGAEDLELWYRIMKDGYKQKGMKEVLYYLGVTSSNMTAKLINNGGFERAYKYINSKNA